MPNTCGGSKVNVLPRQSPLVPEPDVIVHAVVTPLALFIRLRLEPRLWNVLEGIDADISSRSEWEATRTRGIDLLGLKLEEPRSDVGSQGMGLEGMSTVRHPLLLEAVLRGSSNAIGELLPAEGPVKIKNVGEESGEADKQAETYQKDFNHYLTDIATEYYPDTKRMLFWVFFGGCGWKKIYSCPIRRRPVSESVDANDLIISNAATDLWNAGRITHRITMRPSIMKRKSQLFVPP